MESGRDGYVRKRGYSRVHVLTWTIYLEKNGFVPCSFQNCTFMAFNIDEMKNHFNTCKGEGFQAAYECKYCRGRTENGEKLEEHIVRFHGHEADSIKLQADSDMDLRRSSRILSKNIPNEDTKDFSAKPEISKVVIYSWDVSKEMYGYIKCPDCCLLSESVEGMKSHLFNCQKNPSAFAYECTKCNGRVVSETALKHHMVDSHKDSVLEDDAFIENYSHFWKEQIDSCGFAKCGKKCTFIHIDSSIMKKHFKASCSMQSGCQPVIYCSNQSCSVWSTSRTALLKHNNFDHKLKTDDLIEEKITEKGEQQNCKYSRKGKLSDGASKNISPEKYVSINNVKIKDETDSVEMEQQQTDTCESSSSVGCFPTETEVHGLNSDDLKNSHGCEADSDSRFFMVFNPENTKRQYSKQKSEERLRNDDPYQLQSPSDINNEITIDDPLTVESLDHKSKFFVKQSDDSWLEDSVSEKINAPEEGVECNDISDDTALSPEMKAIIDKTRRCYSKMAGVSKQNHINNSDFDAEIGRQDLILTNYLKDNLMKGNIEQTTELQMKDYSKKQESPLENISLSKQKTYSSTKKCGTSDKHVSNCSLSENDSELSYKSILTKETNKLYYWDDDEKLRANEENRISEGTVNPRNECVTTKLPPNVDDTKEAIEINSSECEVNSRFSLDMKQCSSFDKTNDVSQDGERRKEMPNKAVKIPRDTLIKDTIIAGEKSLNNNSTTSEKTDNLNDSTVGVLSPGKGEICHLLSPKNDYSVNKNKRGRTKKSIDVEKDIGRNPKSSPKKQYTSGRLKKMSSGLEKNLEDEVLTPPTHKNILEERESPKKMTSDFGKHLEEVDLTSTMHNDYPNYSAQVQKKKRTPKKITNNSEKHLKKFNPTSTLQDDSSKIQKKRGRPKKISTGSDFGEKSQEVVVTSPLLGEIKRSETKACDLKKQVSGGSICPIQEKVQEETERSNEMISDTKKHLLEMGSISSPNEDNQNLSLKNQKKRGRPRKVSNNLGEMVSSPIQEDIKDGKESSKELSGKMGVDLKGVETTCPKLDEIQGKRRNKLDSGKHLDKMEPSSSPLEDSSSNSLKNHKKRGRPRKMSKNFVENLVSTISIQEDVQDGTKSSKEMTMELGEQLENFEPSCPKPEEIREETAKTIEMSSGTNDLDEMRQLSSLQDDTPNKSLENQKTRGRRRKISSNVGENMKEVESTRLNHEEIQEERERTIEMSSGSVKYLDEIRQISSSQEGTSNIPLKNQTKRGKPRKSGNDFEKNAEEVVPTFPIQGVILERKSSKDVIGEIGNHSKEVVSTCLKHEEIEEERERSIEMSCDTNNYLGELNTNSSPHGKSLNIALKMKKKRGRPKKINSGLGKPFEGEVSRFPIQGEIKEEMAKDLEKGDSTFLTHEGIQEKNERIKDIGRDLDKHSNEIGSTSTSSSEIQKKRRRPRKMSSDLGKHLEVVSSTSTAQEDSTSFPLNSQKKRRRPKKMKLSLGEPLENFNEDYSQVKNCKLSLDSTLKRSNIEERKNYVDELLNEQPNNDSFGKSAIIVDCNKSSSFSTAPELSIKRKPGRPKKTESSLIVSNQPCKEIEPMINRNTKKTPKRNISKPKKFAQYVTEDLFFDANETQSDEIVSKVQSISSMSDQVASASIVPNSNTKRRPGRPKKTQAANVDGQSFNDPEIIKSEKNVQAKRKRTISKPIKLSSYITENSDFEEALGNDGGELLAEDPESSEIAECSDESFKSSIVPQTLKRKPGRQKKSSITALDVPESSAIAECSVESFKSNVVPQTLKRKPGRPKKSSITALDVSIDAENFNSSLETKQNLCSTPRRSLARTISKPKKYKIYVEEPLFKSRRTSSALNALSNETEDVSEDLTVQMEGKHPSRKHKRSSRLSSDASFNPDIEPKMRKIGMIDNEEHVGVEPLDKNKNYSSVDSEKPHKTVTAKKRRLPPRNMIKKITCAICKKCMTRLQFESHAIEHNYFCWIEGDGGPFDYEKEEDIHRNFFQVRKYKSFRGYKCEKCGVIKKSSVGYVSHRSVCGVSDLERESLKVSCPVCKRYMMPSSLKVHMTSEHRPNTKVAMGEVISDLSNKRAAASIAESRLDDEILDTMEIEQEKLLVTTQLLRKWYTKMKKENFSRTLIRWELDLDRDNELVCSEPNCSFKTDSLDTMQAHHSECSKLNREYECRICGIRVKELSDVKQHILTNHAQIIENDGSDYDDKEESGVEEEIKEQQLQQNAIYGKPNFVKTEYHRTGLNFIYRNMQRAHDRLQANYIQGRSLYEDLLAVPNGFLNEDELSKYLPNTPASMKISLGTENWDQLKLMEARSTGESSFVFVGGPVWAMDWCPVPLGDTMQWLAVSCHRDMDAVHKMGEVFSYDNVIQIWDFGALDLCSSGFPTPVLSIGIAHSNGTAWDMRWCPDGCHQPDSGRLGLLAVAFSSGMSVIYSVPLVTRDNGKPFYKLTPVIELTPPYEEPVQCCRIAWSCDNSFNIVAVGYMDGSISLYDITTSSLLLKDGIKIHPYKVITAHTECITALQFIGNKTGKILMTCSVDKCMKFWNLLDTSAPISVFRKTPIRDAVWLANWLCAVSVNDDCYTNGLSHLSMNNFRDFLYLQTVPWVSLSNTQWSIAASDWTNAISMSSETGEIMAIYPSQLFYVDTKSIRRVTVCLSTTVLKKLTSEEDDQEGEKQEMNGPCNYKDATENYGLVFTDIQEPVDNSSAKENIPKHLFPITSVNKITYNPNRQAFTYLAIGHHCGIVRVIRDKHFDFAKKEILNFSNSLLMR